MTAYDVEPFITAEEIEEKVSQLADEINQHYGDTPIVVIGILKGSFMFLSDLVKKLNMNVTIEFMSVSSYGDATKSGDLLIEMDLRKSIKDKTVLIVEDLVDSGKSLCSIIEMLKGREPESIKLATLLTKPGNVQQDPSELVDHWFNGDLIEDVFIVGYGMDYAENHRNLPYIGKVVFQ